MCPLVLTELDRKIPYVEQLLRSQPIILDEKYPNKNGRKENVRKYIELGIKLNKNNPYKPRKSVRLDYERI